MSRYLISVIDQALWSLLNLGVNLLLIRLIAPVHYGVFAFWANCAFVLASLQNALTFCHLQLLAPGDGLSEPRLSIERDMHAVTVMFLLLVALGAAGGVALLGRAGSVLCAPAAVLYLPAYLLQQYIRGLAFTRGRPATAATQTGAVFLAAVGLLAWAYAAKALTPDGILLRLGVAYGVVGVAGAAVATWRQLPGLRLSSFLNVRHYLVRSGWVFLGVSSTELLTRFYVFIVTAWYGSAALASLSATQQLMRPVPLLASAWSMAERPHLARRRDAGDWRGIRRLVGLTTLAGLVMAAGWTALVFGGWGLITRDLFGGKYAAEGWMVLAWGLCAAIGFGQTVTSASLQSLHVFKPLALANAAASLVAAGAIVLVMRAGGYPGAIIGTALGQMLELGVMAWLLRDTLRRAAR